MQQIADWLKELGMAEYFRALCRKAHRYRRCPWTDGSRPKRSWCRVHRSPSPTTDFPVEVAGLRWTPPARRT